LCGRSRNSKGRQGPGLEDSSFWRRERLQGYLTIFTIMTNVVRELGAEPEERGGVPQVR